MFGVTWSTLAGNIPFLVLVFLGLIYLRSEYSRRLQATLKDLVEAYEREIKALKQKDADQEQQIDRLTERLSRTEADARDARDAAQAVAEERDALRRERDALHRERDALRSERNALTKRVKTLEDDYAAAQQKITALEDEHTAAQQKIAALEAEIVELRGLLPKPRTPKTQP